MSSNNTNEKCLNEGFISQKKNSKDTVDTAIVASVKVPKKKKSQKSISASSSPAVSAHAGPKAQGSQKKNSKNVGKKNGKSSNQQPTKISTEILLASQLKNKAKIVDYGFRSSSSGDVAATKELRYRITDFFDYSTGSKQEPETGKSVFNYWVKCYQNPIGDSSSVDTKQALRFGNVNLYVLPPTQLSTSGSPEAIASESKAVFFRFPCSTSIVDSSDIISEANRTTVVIPTYNTKWVHVGGYNMERVLKSGLYRPIFGDKSGVASTADYINLFQLQMLDPDGMTPDDKNDKKFQYKVVYDCYQPLPVANTFDIGSMYCTNFGSFDTELVTESAPVFMELMSMNSNKF